MVKSEYFLQPFSATASTLSTRISPDPGNEVATAYVSINTMFHIIYQTRARVFHLISKHQEAG